MESSVKRFDIGGWELYLSTDGVRPGAVAQQLAAERDCKGEDEPFFVMNADAVVSQHRQWCRLLPRVQPHYAVKCNNDPVLLRLLASLGCGFDCASKNEIQSVLQIPSVHPDRIIYANPCKTRNYVRHAAAIGVRLMTFDNEEELYKVRSLFPEAEMILRIAVSDPTAVCQLNVKFGCDPRTVAPTLLQLAASLDVQVVGISFHVGSGCRDPTAFGLGIAEARRLFNLGKSLGHNMHILDIGGGYPGVCSPEISFAKIAAVVNEALERDFPPGADAGLRIIAEPGRFYAAAALTLCCNIIAKTRVSSSKITGKEDDAAEDGYMYYINDGVYGSFNCILYDHFQPVGRPLFERGNGEEAWSAVWGPTCDGLDLVLPSCRLPMLSEGDWLLFPNMGAYTAAAGSEFNGFPRPRLYYWASPSTWKIYIQNDDEGVETTSSEDDSISVFSSTADDTDQDA